jgi:hypothetical protein
MSSPGYSLTAGFNLQQPFAYSPEASYAAALGDSPVFNPVAIGEDYRFRVDNKTIDIGQVGQEELYNILSTGHDYGFNVSVHPFNLPYLQYGASDPNYLTPAGTPAESLHHVMKIIAAKDADGLWGTHWIKMPGSICDSLEISLDSESAVYATMGWMCQKVTALELAHGYTGTPDFPEFTDITGSAIGHLEAGTDTPLLIGADEYPVESFRIAWANTVEPTRFINSDLINSALVTRRVMTGSFSTGFGLDHALQALIRDKVPADGKMTLKLGTMVVTMDQMMLTNSEPSLQTGVMVPDYNFKCINATLGTT